MNFYRQSFKNGKSWSLNVIYFLQILRGDGSKITSDICWSHSAVFFIFGYLEFFGYSQGYINESRDSSTFRYSQGILMKVEIVALYMKHERIEQK